ncbi:LOW QUALITY PROTEIN: conserved hypothetical protein, partial [Mycobacterium tuberculosis GM 1503]
MKLIDTTIAVDHLRGEPAAAVLLRRTDKTTVRRSRPAELVRFELLAGVRGKRTRALEAFLSRQWWWTLVTEDIARIGGRLARRYRSSHPRYRRRGLPDRCDRHCGRRRPAHHQCAPLPDVPGSAAAVL